MSHTSSVTDIEIRTCVSSMMYLFSEDNLDTLRNMPGLYWLFLTFLCISAHLGGVCGVHDFTVYRMQHLDLHGTHMGSRSALLNMEARGMAASMLNRKCVFIKWAELSSDLFQDLLNRGAGSLIIILPSDWSHESNETIASWVDLESHLLSLEIPIPLYFTYETPRVMDIYESLTASSQSDSTGSATSTLISSLIGEGYFIVADSPEATPLTDSSTEIVTMTGKLMGSFYNEDLPTVAIVTHYDSFGLVPSLAMSGGSGVAAILELARFFSTLYSNTQHKPKYNILFVITGGGNLNYFGTKYFIEDMSEDADSHLLIDADYTLCLDALSEGSELYVHVSKPPKAGTKAHELLQHLNKTAHFLHQSSVVLNHKKIRIGEDLMAWEHERFSLRRIAAATLSHFKDHTNPMRKSMFNVNTDVEVLYRNVKVLAEAIGRHILDMDDMDDYTTPLLTGSLKIKEKYLKAWLDKLSSIPRSQQLFDKNHVFITSLEQTLAQYVHEVSTFAHKPDKNDPEFVLYSAQSTQAHIYRVKPAIFDLFLALCIAAYIGLIYLVIVNFKAIQEAISHFGVHNKSKGE